MLYLDVPLNSAKRFSGPVGPLLFPEDYSVIHLTKI